MFALLMGLKPIPRTAVVKLIREKRVTVIDVNDPSRWRNEHVPGALNVDPGAFSASELPGDQEALLVFYCSGHLCRKAPDAARRAEAMGYLNVRVMSGDISGWTGAGLPMAGAPVASRLDYLPASGPSLELGHRLVDPEHMQGEPVIDDQGQQCLERIG